MRSRKSTGQMRAADRPRRFSGHSIHRGVDPWKPERLLYGFITKLAGTGFRWRGCVIDGRSAAARGCGCVWEGRLGDAARRYRGATRVKNELGEVYEVRDWVLSFVW